MAVSKRSAAELYMYSLKTKRRSESTTATRYTRVDTATNTKKICHTLDLVGKTDWLSVYKLFVDLLSC